LPKNSEISPGKKTLVPSSPPQNILGSTLCGVWDVPDFWNVLYWALYQDSVGFSWSKKTKHLEDTRNIHGLKFSTKFVAN
jgi:hypothetical protein